MSPTRSLSSLSPASRRLVGLMQQVHFGRIERLAVRHGEPLFDPPPRVIRTLKIGGRNEPRPESASRDFLLKREVLELLGQLAQVGEGMIARIEVAHGLPLLLEVEDSALC